MIDLKPSRIASVLGWVLFFLQVNLLGVTLEELRNDSKLTPRKFASYFSSFEFQFRGDVQSPDVFLSTQSGDCDDFATLAAKVLSEKGFTTRLIAVRLESVVHVVCYVEETKSYLDYNYRTSLRKTVSSGNSIHDIAEKVAKSFHEKWTTASEFTYQAPAKRLVATVVGTHGALAKAEKTGNNAPRLFSFLAR